MLTACSRVSLSLVLSLSAAGSRGTPRLDSSPPERQPARLLGNGNPGAGELRSRQPGELQGRPLGLWGRAGGRSPCANACRQRCLAGDSAWQDTELAVLLETSAPKEPSGALRFLFGSPAEGKAAAGAGSRPVSCCQQRVGAEQPPATGACPGDR